MSRVEILKYCVDLIGGLSNVKLFAHEDVYIEAIDLPEDVYNGALKYGLTLDDVAENINFMINYYMKKYKSRK